MSDEALELLQRRQPARPRVTPLGRRLALANGLALTAIAGSGPGGRVMRRDVERYLAAAASAGLPVDHPRGAPPVSTDPQSSILPAAVKPPATVAPTAWLMIEVDLSTLLARRLPTGGAWRQPTGVAPAVLIPIVVALVDTLLHHPLFNAAWSGTAIRLRPSIELALIDRGTPLAYFPHAERQSAASLEASLVEPALTGPAETAATFTLFLSGSHPGLVQPGLPVDQTGCLTVSDPVRRPAVVDDAIALRWIATLGLVFDHRVVDGAPAGAFLRALKERLERDDSEAHAGVARS